jgi:hypothetical protein
MMAMAVRLGLVFAKQHPAVAMNPSAQDLNIWHIRQGLKSQRILLQSNPGKY